MRKLMDEERAGMQVWLVVQDFPLIGLCPSVVAVAMHGKRGRRQGQRIQDDCFAVTFPTVMQESDSGFSPA